MTVKEKVNHIAIIMDGNRRWAKEHNLPTPAGHKKGVESLRKIVRACDRAGVKYLTVYAFSTENWNRKKEEVDFLMDLVAVTLKNDLDEMHNEGVKISFIGDCSKLSINLQKVIKDAEIKTRDNKGVNLQIALNYGARDEITNAVKCIVNSGISAEDVTQELISQNLYTHGIPDPDVLIRTGGEKRISNYLLWQIAYTEIVVVNEYWPDFDEKLLNICLEEFYCRQRRYGK